jgi:hypothetical protein
MALHDFNSDLAWPLNTPFGLPQFHGHGCWLVCEVALMVNRPCSVTNTKCTPNIILSFLVRDLGHHTLKMFQLSSLTKWIFIQISIIHHNMSSQIWQSLA